jgi:serine/threonine protein kinase
MTEKTFALKDRYYNITKIGKGCFGTAFRAIDRITQLPVCIKRIEGIFDFQNKNINSFPEFETLMKLNHPNLIQYKNSFYENNSLYIVTEYAPYGTLSDFIQRFPYGLQIDVIFRIFFQILDPLMYLDKNNIFHHNLKPANILFSGN